MTGLLRLLITVFLSFGFTSAWGQSLSKSTNKTVQKATNKTGALKKKEEVAINKNLSPAEQQRLTSQKWSFILSSGASRSLDELSDYGGSLSGSASYRLNNKVLLTSGLGYEYLFYKRGGSFLVNEDDPRYYGLTDLRLGFSMPRVINLPEMKSFINFSGSVALPTSQSSQRASQYYSSALTASMISFVTPKFLVNSYTSVLHASHEYSEANATGTALNSPFGLSVGATLSYNLVKGLTGFAGYNVNARYEYDNGFRNIQSISSGVQYAITPKMYVTGAFFWRDQFVTNDSVFDDDKSYYSISFDYFL